MAHWKSRACCSRRYDTKHRHRKHKPAAQKLKSLPAASSSTKNSSRKSSSKSSSHNSSSKTESGRKHKLDSSISGVSGTTTNSAKYKVKKYRTRQSVRESNNSSYVEDSSNSSNLDMPSTSTGITGSSNSSVYRIIEDDSDDEATSAAAPPPSACPPEIAEQELINILPTPLNGTHDMYNTDNTTDNAHNAHDASAGYTDTDSSMYESEGVVSLTPNFKGRNGEAAATPESGIGSSGPCSSSGGGGSVYRRHHHHHLACSSSTNGNGALYIQTPLDDCSDVDQDYVYESFKRRVKKARLNIRNQIFGDSDSN